MATTFNWIHLGSSSVQLDMVEGNSIADNAVAIVGNTYGTAGNPLFTHVTSATMKDNGGLSGSLDTNNSVSNDQFTTNIGAGSVTLTLDTAVQYNATLTYADGTTATITAVVVQDNTGQLFLAPETSLNADTLALEAKPILSIALNSTSIVNATGLATNRLVTGFDDGYIDGTAGNDLINGSFVEAWSGGSDKVDNGDAGLAGSGGNDDYIRAGDGNDTVFAALGHDKVYSGTGNDLLYGGLGDDRFILEIASDGDTITDFDLGDADANGFTNDQLDVSDLLDGQGNPVNTFDVVVTNDGSGNAVLTFPGGESLVLQGVSPSVVNQHGMLHAM